MCEVRYDYDECSFSAKLSEEEFSGRGRYCNVCVAVFTASSALQ
jgi:hypothetical protein